MFKFLTNNCKQYRELCQKGIQDKLKIMDEKFDSKVDAVDGKIDIIMETQKENHSLLVALVKKNGIEHNS